MKLNLNYYYGSEVQQFSFFRVPKLLFTEPAYESLSSEGKLLYSLMLDRMGLSVRNQWFDSLGRVYIFFTVSDAMDKLHYKHDKIIRLFKELDDIGLIERKKQGLGKPNMIYVKNFIMQEDGPHVPEPIEAAAGKESPEVSNQEVKTFQNGTSGGFKSGSQEVGKTDTNKTEYNKTDRNKTNLSIDPRRTSTRTPTRKREAKANGIDPMDIGRKSGKKKTVYDVSICAKSPGCLGMLSRQTRGSVSDDQFSLVNTDVPP